MNKFIDLLEGDCLISSMLENRVYLVGGKYSNDVYLCRRDGINLFICLFKFNMQHDFVMRIENGSLVKGFNCKTNKFFEERLLFCNVTIKDLLYTRMSSYRATNSGVGYVREFLPSHSINA